MLKETETVAAIWYTAAANEWNATRHGQIHEFVRGDMTVCVYYTTSGSVNRAIILDGDERWFIDGTDKLGQVVATLRNTKD